MERAPERLLPVAAASFWKVEKSVVELGIEAVGNVI